MREIKFRAWEKPSRVDRFLGKMHYDIIPYLSKWLKSKDYEIMQYTGLKDKNGNEIYEGDIVKSTLVKDEGNIEKIYWREYLCGWSIPSESHAEFFEIIGNIYENPDLLSTQPSQ